jgi:hypothetical protein
VLFLICLFLTGYVLLIVMSIHRLDDAYAQWGAAEMVIDYMADHDGEWPKSWTDLQPYFDNGGGRVAGWSYERFQKHVWIDFTADPNLLRELSQAADKPLFNVIDSTSMFGPCFEDGPNGILMRHFNPSTRRSASPSTAALAPGS